MITDYRLQITEDRMRMAIIAAALVFGLNWAMLAFAGEDHTWKVSDARYGAKTAKVYNGINEGLIWVKEVLACSGGWNGSADYQKFDNAGLQRYRVNKNGDLVFPDDTVWYKSEGYAKAHAAGINTWKKAMDNSDIDDCADNDSQYEYAQNKPSALAIADAWDGVKNLISGLSGTHKKEDGYYADNAMSWYKDIGNGKGRSRLPAIAEYQKAGEGSLDIGDSLLSGTANYPQYQWSEEQDEELYFVRSYSQEGAKEGRELVSYPFGGCWVVEK